MSPEEKKQITQKLLQEIDATKKDIERLEELTRPIAPDNAIGRLSRMEALNSKSLNEAALEDALIKLPKLENTLAKIDQPDFGNCKKCGAEIPFKRLLFMPESSLCVACTLHR